MAIGVQQRQRRGTAAEWNTSDVVLADGELGVTTDTGILKIGDGVNTWTELPVAFESRYLGIGAKAADSELLDGVSADNFVVSYDVDTAATADKIAKRGAGGRLKAAAGVSTDDVVNFDQMVAADIVSKRNVVIRNVSAAPTLQVTDAGNIVMVNNAVRNVTMAVNIPTNASVGFAVGAWVDICAIGVGPAVATPASGVTLLGDGRCYGNYGSIRLLKIDTNAWLVSRRDDPPDAYAKAFMYMDTNSPDLSLFWRHVPLNNETIDTHNGHVTGTITGDDTDTTGPKQTNRYTVQPGQAGIYKAQAMIMVDRGGGPAQIAARLLKNGATILGGYGENSSSSTAFTGEKILSLAEGDWIGPQGYCEVAGWNFSSTSSATECSWMSVERIA